MQMKIDGRKSYLIGLDTETCNGLVVEDKLDLSQSLVYDIGWCITDKQGNIYATRSYVVYEIYVKMKDVMQSAYYKDKLPQYEKDIKSGKRILATLGTIRKVLLDDCMDYHIKAIFAHNASFDVRALNNTIRYITKSKKRYFLPYGTEIWDTLKMANSTIVKQKTYIKFCNDNNYMTNHKIPRPRATAEILYRYLTLDNDFIESHTGLEDVLIETYILVRCFKTHKKMNKVLYPTKG